MRVPISIPNNTNRKVPSRRFVNKAPTMRIVLLVLSVGPTHESHTQNIMRREAIS